MRELFRSKALTTFAAIISFAAIAAAGIVATAPPALASVTICNAAGSNGYCAGDPAPVNNGDEVVLTVGGRNFNLVDQHFTCCGGNEVFQLQFVAAPSQCVGIAASGTVTVRDCSGGDTNFTNWAKVPHNGAIRWESTANNNPPLYLASDNRLGHALFALQLCTNCGIFFAWSD